MVYLFLVFNKLPDIVPIHFNINGEADDFTNKQNLIWMLLALNGIAYLLFLIIPKIDPKKKYSNDDKIYLRIRLVMTLLLSGISVLLVYLANGDTEKGITILALMFGAMCVLLGNYLQAVKPNYFLGIRTPWTLSDDENWKKTHLFSGRFLFFGGIISVLLIFAMPSNLAPIPPVSNLLIGTLGAAIYSFILSRKQKGATM